MNQQEQVNAAIRAIRAISAIYSEDVAEITAALSSTIAKDANAHGWMHQVAVEELDELTDWLNDQIGERVAIAEREAKEDKPARQCDEEGAVQRFQSWMKEVSA
jgi:hypothetical protein